MTFLSTVSLLQPSNILLNSECFIKVCQPCMLLACTHPTSHTLTPTHSHFTHSPPSLLTCAPNSYSFSLVPRPRPKIPDFLGGAWGRGYYSFTSHLSHPHTPHLHSSHVLPTPTPSPLTPLTPSPIHSWPTLGWHAPSPPSHNQGMVRAISTLP